MSDQKEMHGETLERMLAFQVKQLQTMEQAETRRLGFLSGDQPERALAVQKECDTLFERSSDLQEKIGHLMRSVEIKELGQGRQQNIHALESMVRKLAKRNLELNKRSQEVLNQILHSLSDQLSKIRVGRKAVNSYHNPEQVLFNRLTGRI